MSNVTIKPVIVKEHYAVISELMRALHENERILNSKTALWDDIEAPYMHHISMMQDECDGVCLIAYVEDVPVGFIFGYIEEEDDSRFEEYSGKILYVSDGYIVPEHRRKGIYRRMNKELERHFIDMGVRRITRFTLLSNEQMRRFLVEEGYAGTRILFEKWIDPKQ